MRFPNVDSLIGCNSYIYPADWIPSYLQQETQVSLRVEMEKARSQSDVPGYIYTFEIRGALGVGGSPIRIEF